MINKIKNMIQAYKNIYTYSYDKEYYKKLAKKGVMGPCSGMSLLLHTEINEEGYIIKEDPAYVMNNNGLYAAVTVATFNSIYGIGTTVDVPVIATDRFFNRLSEDAKEFLIAHELHHFYEQREALQEIGGAATRVMDFELEADQAGAKRVGTRKAIKALEEIRDKAVGVINKDEMNERILSLKKVLCS